MHWNTQTPSIWNVEIKEKYRGIGLGSQMMKECVEFLRKDPSNPTRAYLYVNVDNIPAIKIYEKAGFVMTEDFIRNGSAVQMEILL